MAFEKIEDAERERVEKLLYKSIIEEYQKNKISEEYYQYEVILQKRTFITDMTDQELKDTVHLAVDVMEELKEINNDGLYKEKFANHLKEVGADSGKGWELMQVLKIWQIFLTEQMKKIIAEIDKTQRVGGAWAMLLANPELESAILSVYKIIVDNFDNPKLYYHSADFLIRAIMNMHGQACCNED